MEDEVTVGEDRVVIRLGVLLVLWLHIEESIQIAKCIEPQYTAWWKSQAGHESVTSANVKAEEHYQPLRNPWCVSSQWWLSYQLNLLIKVTRFSYPCPRQSRSHLCVFSECLAHGVLLLTFIRSLHVVGAHSPLSLCPRVHRITYAIVYPLMDVWELDPGCYQQHFHEDANDCFVVGTHTYVCDICT